MIYLDVTPTDIKATDEPTYDFSVVVDTGSTVSTVNVGLLTESDLKEVLEDLETHVSKLLYKNF